MSLDLVTTHRRQGAALARIWGNALPALCAVEDLEQVGWEALRRCLRRCDPRTRSAPAHGAAPVTRRPLEATLPDPTPGPTPEPVLAAAVARLPPRGHAIGAWLEEVPGSLSLVSGSNQEPGTTNQEPTP